MTNFTHVPYTRGRTLDENFMVVVMVSGGYEKTFEDYFLSTLPADISVVMALLPEENHKDLAGGTEDSLYKEYMLHRLELYLSYVKGRPRGSKLLFLDCDVTFFGPFKEELSDYLDEYDVCIQKGYIGGIIAVSCNEKSELFFETLVSRCRSIPPSLRKDGFPQWTLIELIHEFTEERKLKLTELPEKYGFLTDDMVLYHAINGGKTVTQKNAVLSFVHQMKSNTVNKMWQKFVKDPSYKDSVGKHLLVVSESDEHRIVLWPSWVNSVTMWQRFYEDEDKSEVRRLFEEKYNQIYPAGHDYSSSHIYGGPGPSQYYACMQSDEEVKQLYPGAVYLAPLII